MRGWRASTERGVRRALRRGRPRRAARPEHAYAPHCASRADTKPRRAPAGRHKCSESRRRRTGNGPRETDGAGAASGRARADGCGRHARRPHPRRPSQADGLRLLLGRLEPVQRSLRLALRAPSAVLCCAGCRWKRYAQRCRCRGPMRPGGAAAAPARARGPWLRRARHPARSYAPQRRTSTGRRWSDSRELRAATCSPPALRCSPSRRRSLAPTTKRPCRCAR